MTTPDPAHRQAATLVARYITSVEQLEILLLLRRTCDRTWTAAAVAEELRTSEASAKNRLADLVAAGLVEVSTQSVAALRYAPSAAWKRAAVDELAALYAERPYYVIDMIFAKPIANLYLYADAFRYGKDDEDDG